MCVFNRKSSGKKWTVAEYRILKFQTQKKTLPTKTRKPFLKNSLVTSNIFLKLKLKVSPDRFKICLMIYFSESNFKTSFLPSIGKCIAFCIILILQFSGSVVEPFLCKDFGLAILHPSRVDNSSTDKFIKLANGGIKSSATFQKFGPHLVHSDRFLVLKKSNIFLLVSSDNVCNYNHSQNI